MVAAREQWSVIALAVMLGALYGYVGLQLLSGLAPAAIVIVAGLCLLAWRLPARARDAVAVCLGFTAGFAVLWVALLAGRPYCCGVLGDTAWAAGLLLFALVPSAVTWTVHRRITAPR